MKHFTLVFAAALALAACGSHNKALLPNVSGKAGEVVVVLDKDNWEGAAGYTVREFLACECPFLPQVEPLYTLVNVPPGSFGDLFKIHRNIVYCEINPQATSEGVVYKRDVWASPQCVIVASAPDAASLVGLFADNAAQIVSAVERRQTPPKPVLTAEAAKVVSAIEQAERDRVIRNSMLYEERSLFPAVAEVFGGSPHFPSGYKLKKKTSDFIWIADEKQYTIQGVLIYSTPVLKADNFSVGNIIARRNEVLKANVPGMFDNTWMTTSEFWTPTVEHIRYNGRNFTQTRGLWEVQNDYMGGPFVSHTFYSRDGSRIITAEAFVYAPKYDKRQYLRQVESILYSWEWKEPAAGSGKEVK